VTPGDVNGDGKINSKDVTLIKRFISGVAAESDLILGAADVNGDGKTNAQDVTRIKRMISGII